MIAATPTQDSRGGCFGFCKGEGDHNEKNSLQPDDRVVGGHE